MGILDKINEINGVINGIVWGVPMLILIVGCGIYMSFRLGFFQFAHFGHAMRNTIGKCFGKNAKKTAGSGSVTPLQAVTTALAATVGTGNIVGVTGAIAMGGPGAVFWMEVSALVGMLTKFSEVTLSIKFRERNANGDWVGGPMYYIKNGLGPKFKWLACLFAALGAIAAFGIGNLTQVNSIATSITSSVNTLFPDSASHNFTICLCAGIVMSVICVLTYLGGIKRIGSVTEKLVPVMAIVYILSSLVVIFANIGNIGPVLKSIFVGAFSPSAVVGGAAGIGIQTAMTRGVSRGVFSNEAGLGSAPIAHAAADTEGPVQQGLFGIFEVFADTIVICTMTALVILMSGTPIDFGKSAGVELTNAAFSSVFGPGASIVVALGLCMFAGSTILSWGLYGTRCAEFLFGPKVIKPYQVLFCILVIVGSVMELSLAWNIADTLNALMAIPNLIAVLALSPVVIKLLKEYKASTPLKRERERAGK
jgi:AGCS family alanine or glycine:cation symporter